jgi:TctA family transporter
LIARRVTSRFGKSDATVFFTRPLSLAFMIGTVLILAVMIAPAVRPKGEGHP